MMRCRFCGAETRETGSHTELDGFVVSRARQCLAHAEHKFNTLEIDDSIEGTIRKFGVAEHRRSKFEVIVRNHERDMNMWHMFQGGGCYRAIALAYCLSESYVRRTIQRIQLGRKHGRHYSVDEAKAYIAAANAERLERARRERALAVGHGGVPGVSAQVGCRGADAGEDAGVPSVRVSQGYVSKVHRIL